MIEYCVIAILIIILCIFKNKTLKIIKNKDAVINHLSKENNKLNNLLSYQRDKKNKVNLNQLAYLIENYPKINNYYLALNCVTIDSLDLDRFHSIVDLKKGDV